MESSLQTDQLLPVSCMVLGAWQPSSGFLRCKGNETRLGRVAWIVCSEEPLISVSWHIVKYRIARLPCPLGSAFLEMPPFLAFKNKFEETSKPMALTTSWFSALRMKLGVLATGSGLSHLKAA